MARKSPHVKNPTPGQPGDTTPPATPTGFSATPTGATTVSLVWTPNTDDTTSYVIRRSLTSNITLDGADIVTKQGISSSSHTDSGLTQGTLYYYNIRAADAAGNNSPVSITDTAQTSASGTSPEYVGDDNYYPGQNTFFDLRMSYVWRDAENDPITYSVVSGTLPTGMSFLQTPARIAGVPTVLGESTSVVVQANDGIATPTQKTLNFTVLTNAAPIWTVGNNHELNTVDSAVGAQVDFNDYAVDFEADPLVFTLTSQSKSGVAGDYGITLDEQTGVLDIPAGLTADSYSVTIDLSGNAALADWQYRTQTGPYADGVQWYHDFSTQAQRDAFVTTDDMPNVDWFPSGGPGDFGYISCKVYSNVGAADNVWKRPMAALPGEPGYRATTPATFNPNSPGSFGFHGTYGHPSLNNTALASYHGHEYYMQCRLRTTKGRWGNHGGLGEDVSGESVPRLHTYDYPTADQGKFIWFTWLNSTPADEFVMTARYWGTWGVYNTTGGIDRSQIPDGAYIRKEPDGFNDATCRYVSADSGPSQWALAENACERAPSYLNYIHPNDPQLDEWVTYLVRVKLGTVQGPAGTIGDTEFDIWIAEGGEYRKLLGRTNAAWAYSAGAIWGHCAVACSAYHNGYRFREAWSNDWAQIIFSTAWIPPPAAGL